MMEKEAWEKFLVMAMNESRKGNNKYCHFVNSFTGDDGNEYVKLFGASADSCGIHMNRQMWTKIHRCDTNPTEFEIKNVIHGRGNVGTKNIISQDGVIYTISKDD